MKKTPIDDADTYEDEDTQFSFGVTVGSFMASTSICKNQILYRSQYRQMNPVFLPNDEIMEIERNYLYVIGQEKQKLQSKILERKCSLVFEVFNYIVSELDKKINIILLRSRTAAAKKQELSKLLPKSLGSSDVVLGPRKYAPIYGDQPIPVHHSIQTKIGQLMTAYATAAKKQELSKLLPKSVGSSDVVLGPRRYRQQSIPVQHSIQTKIGELMTASASAGGKKISKQNKKYTRKIKKSRSSSQKLNSRRKYKRKTSSKQSQKRIYEKSSNSKQRRTRKIRKN
jgi:hypothetical protein